VPRLDPGGAAESPTPRIDAEALRAGGRAFGAMAERCQVLAGALRGGSQALHHGPGAWAGPAAEAGRRRADRLGTALDRAAAACADTAAVLLVLAAAVEDELAAARTAGLGRPAGEQVAAVTATAAAGFAEIAGRARAVCALVGRESGWATAVDRRLHGPADVWSDLREGLAKGARDLLGGTARAAALGSPPFWLLRPAWAWEQGRQTLRGGVAALRHPGAAVAAALGTEDLVNGHAARFWAQFGPSAAISVATRGSSLARETAVLGGAARGPAAHSLAHVNPGYPGPGRQSNCANCALATDATLAGRPACALPGGATSIRVLEAHFGRPFEYVSSAQRMVAKLARAGPGARGIVFASRGTRRPGHLFNVANLDGTVTFVDGQHGGAAAVDGQGYVAFYLLRTD
jgi:hypothetical protein